MAQNGSTSTIGRHAKNKHKVEWNEAKARIEGVAPEITEHFPKKSTVKKYPKNSKKQKDFERQLVKTYAKHYLPVQYVEYKELQSLFNLTADGSKFRWPSRKRFSKTLIPRIYEEEELKLKEEIKNR